jgi:hypothetical protein
MQEAMSVARRERDMAAGYHSAARVRCDDCVNFPEAMANTRFDFGVVQFGERPTLQSAARGHMPSPVDERKLTTETLQPLV